jgi:hypothetical protein
MQNFFEFLYQVYLYSNQVYFFTEIVRQILLWYMDFISSKFLRKISLLNAIYNKQNICFVYIIFCLEMFSFAILKIHGTEEHPDVGKQLYYQALIYYRRVRARPGGCVNFNEVQRTYERALTILEVTLGNDHKRTIDCRSKLAKLTGNQQERNVLGTRPNKASGSKQQQATVITID